MSISGEYIATSGAHLKLRGRIDLLLETEINSKITEFKTVVIPAGTLKDLGNESIADFQLQASLYAYLLEKKYLSKKQDSIPKVECSVKVLNLCDGESKTWNIEWSRLEIEKRLEQYISILEIRLKNDADDQSRRTRMASRLTWFEEEFRSGQEEMVQEIESTFQQGSNLLWQAPTGYGKTATMLYAALKHSLSSGGQLFYAIAKGTGRDPVRHCVNKIIESREKLKVLFISAKEDLCEPKLEGCTSESCERKRHSFGNNVDTDIPPDLQGLNIITEYELRRSADKNGLCPADLQRELVKRVDIVVGDYNFIYDPVARLSAFRDNDYKQWTLLIDEAHNLVNRGHDIFSVNIAFDDVKACLQLMIEDRWRFSESDEYSAMIAQVETLLEQISVSLMDIDSGEIAPIPPSEGLWSELAQRFGVALGRLLLVASERLDNDIEEMLHNINGRVQYTNELLGFDRSSHLFFGDADNQTIGIMCLDAAVHFSHVNAGFGSVGAFSGSIQPFQYYRSALGLDGNPLNELHSSSIFPPENRIVVLANGINTRLKHRQSSAPEISQTLSDFCSFKQGGYLAIFPSFKFIEMIIPYLRDEGINLLVQRPNMNSADVDRLISSMSNTGETNLALIVAGGKLAEAVDYTGEACVGVAVVGPCLPPPEPFRQALRYYWQSMGEDGEKIAYIMPAMQKVVQATGRMLRHPEERGVILLMDDRFLSERYVDLLPDEWLRDLQYSGNDWREAVNKFWNEGVSD